MSEALAMIPGTLCDSSLFKHQIKHLSKLSHCSVVDTASSDKLEQVARNIIDQFKESFSIIGLSYGGIIAFEILRQAPEKVNKLILLNTTHKPPAVKTQEKMNRFLTMAKNGSFKSITADHLKDAMIHPGHAKQSELRKLVMKMATNVGPESFENQVKAQLDRPDSTLLLKEIKCPTLLIAGKEDNVCPPELHEEMCQLIPNATLKILENCGHLSTIEQPDEVNQIIKDWWVKQDAVCERIA